MKIGLGVCAVSAGVLIAGFAIGQGGPPGVTWGERIEGVVSALGFNGSQQGP